MFFVLALKLKFGWGLFVVNWDPFMNLFLFYRHSV